MKRQGILAPSGRGGMSTAHLLNRYGTVWMAGIAAETLVYGNAEGGAQDREKLYTLLAKLEHPAGIYQQQERAFALQARTLLQAHWSSYQALVVAMEKRTPVAECSAIVSQHLSGN